MPFSIFEKIKCLWFAIILLIIGFPAIIFASITSNESVSIILLTIGVTCIISIVTIIVESILRDENIKQTDANFKELKSKSENLIKNLTEEIEKKTISIEEKMDKIERKFELAGKLISSGVIDILSDRWENEGKYHDTIKKYLSEYANQIKDNKDINKEVWIMGIASRHFFQNETYRNELIGLKQLNVTFKVLLLDAGSEAAKERSKIESPNIYENDYLNGFSVKEKRDYNSFVDTAMFKDLFDAYDYITRTSPSWLENFKIQYYKNDPSFFLIRFPDKLILETYHLGSAKECKIPSERPRNFSGGRIPIFVFDSKFITYDLISNHFDQIWRNSPKTPKDNDIADFFIRSNQQRNSQSDIRNRMQNRHN